MDDIIDAMNILDDYKEKLNNYEYLLICNYLKRIYNKNKKWIFVFE